MIEPTEAGRKAYLKVFEELKAELKKLMELYDHQDQLLEIKQELFPTNQTDKTNEKDEENNG